jgi:hypothetical protein
VLEVTTLCCCCCCGVGTANDDEVVMVVADDGDCGGLASEAIGAVLVICTSVAPTITVDGTVAEARGSDDGIIVFVVVVDDEDDVGTKVGVGVDVSVGAVRGAVASPSSVITTSVSLLPDVVVPKLSAMITAAGVGAEVDGA